MSSILTNLSAMTAVQNLAATQKSLADVQNQISTGLAISSAKDNAAYYSIAQGLRTNVSNLSAVSSSLNLGASVLSTATAATNNLYSVLQSIQKNLVSAAQPGTDLASLQTSINTLRTQLGTTVSTAAFNGVNLLDGSNPTAVSFVSGVTGSGADTVVSQLSIATNQTNLSGATYVSGTNALAKAATTADAAAVPYNNALNAFNNAISAISGGISPTSLAANNNAALTSIFGAGATISGNTVTVGSGASVGNALIGTGGTYVISQAPSLTTITAGPTANGVDAVAANSIVAGAATGGTGSAASTYATAASTYNSAKGTYNTALDSFNTAVGGLTSTTFAAGQNAFKAIFGNNATISTSGANTVVTLAASGDTGSAVSLLGGGATYTIPTAAIGASATVTTVETLAGATAGSAYGVFAAAGTTFTAAQTAYTTAQTTFNSAVSALGTGGVTQANYQQIFGAASTFNTSTGVVSNIQANTVGAAFLGTAAGASYQTAFASAGSNTNAMTTFYGSGATSGTTAATAPVSSLAKAQYNADAAAMADPAAKTAYLVDTAAAATNANNSAKAAYATAKSTFTTAAAALTQTDYNNQSAAFQAVFGANAAYNTTAGTVSGIGQATSAGALIGTGGTYTVANGTYSTTGTDAASGGALFTLYGTTGTSATTDATATGGTAVAAKSAVTAVNANTNASLIYNGALFQVSQINLIGASKSDIANYTSQVGAALTALTAAQEVLGAASSNLSLQTSYVSTLSDSLTTGVGSLVDADMNEASTRLNALQTQQQLGVQALSVANQNSQLILKLFQ